MDMFKNCKPIRGKIGYQKVQDVWDLSILYHGERDNCIYEEVQLCLCHQPSGGIKFQTYFLGQISNKAV